jgi:hypothetical protein
LGADSRRDTLAPPTALLMRCAGPQGVARDASDRSDGGDFGLLRRFGRRHPAPPCRPDVTVRNGWTGQRADGTWIQHWLCSTGWIHSHLTGDDCCSVDHSALSRAEPSPCSSSSRPTNRPGACAKNLRHAHVPNQRFGPRAGRCRRWADRSAGTRARRRSSCAGTRGTRRPDS